ncbi:BMP family protein [Pseudoflavonifractor sp. 524-17]|uniref:BMP family protein n=1 Tax=Pseudoflavonifractor sp. 524-17 TaxID=2304577 RepID=UPI00137A68B3|nr:BMP family protein [Pseudoflavonifractor sp. 524-17]
MKIRKQLAQILSGALLVTMLAACGGGGGGSNPSAAPNPSDGGGEGGYKVAMLLTGYINDAGWNQSAYEGLQMAQEEFGVTGAYTEAIPQPDFEAVMRDYADQGYDMVICVGNEFSDAALAVAPSFPNVSFAVMNGNNAAEPNVGAYRFNTPEAGFTAGAIAAMYSQGGTVGVIGGSTAPHIKDAAEAFKVGAQYINPDINVLIGYTETMTDVAKGKEMGVAFIEQGADVLSANANSASLGVIDAAKEKGILHIGYISDQYDVAPETVMVSMIQSNPFMIRAIVESGVNGTFEPKLNLFGMKEGALYLSDFHGNDSKLTDEQKAKIDEIVAAIKDGSLKEAGILPKSSFEQ